MITSRRSLFGWMFGGAVASTIEIPDPKIAEIRRRLAEPAPLPKTKTVMPDLPIRIRLGHPRGGIGSTVHVGDLDVSSICRAVSVHSVAGELSLVHLELLARGDSFVDIDPGVIDLQVRDFGRRLRFEADHVRVTADV